MKLKGGASKYAGQKVTLLRDCGELKAGETLITFAEGEDVLWASRDGTKKTPYCSGEHAPDDPKAPAKAWERLT